MVVRAEIVIVRFYALQMSKHCNEKETPVQVFLHRSQRQNKWYRLQLHPFIPRHISFSCHANLYTSLFARTTLGKLREQVSDIIPRMSVQTSTQSLLIEEVGNQTDRATQNKETVENTHLEVVLSLLIAERAGVAEEIDEADGDAAVDVEDEVVFLGGCDGFDGEGIVKELGAREVGLAVLFHERYAEIGVVAGLDSVADTGDCVMLAMGLTLSTRCTH